MKLTSALIAAALFLLTGRGALANGLRPLPLDVQFARAQLVVVARLGERMNCAIPPENDPCVEILTEVIFKGDRARFDVRRYLILSSPIAEMSIENLSTPGRVLLFLEGGQTRNAGLLTRRQVYAPVLGHRSVIPMSD